MKNGKTRPRNARVTCIVENKVAPFLPDTVYINYIDESLNSKISKFAVIQRLIAKKFIRCY